MGLKGGEKRAPHGQLAGCRVPPGTAVLIFQPFTPGFPALADCTKTHTALGALEGMAWAGCGRNQRALCPTPRRACCTPGTRDSPSVQSCLLGPAVWPVDR